MNPIYRFSINGRSIRPSFSEDLLKEYALESGQRFFRETLAGKMALINDDYAWLNSQIFDTIFNFLVEKSNDGGVTWVEYYHGTFMKTDCSFDDDDKKVVLKIKPLDLYAKIMEGYEKEFDLIKLAPSIVPINIKKRPLLQLYIAGDDKVSCFLGGTSWEVDATATTDIVDLRIKYRFHDVARFKEVNLTVETNPLNANGIYAGELIWNPGITKFEGSLYANDTDSLYRIDVSEGYTGLQWNITMNVVRIIDSVMIFTKYQDGDPNQFDDYLLILNPTPEGGALGTANADMFTYSIYSRYMLDVNVLNGANTFDIQPDDIVDNSLNYKKIYPAYNLNSYISTELSINPTKFGLSNDGKYYLPPSDATQEFVPLSRNRWRYASVWFGMGDYDWDTDRDGRKDYTLRTTHPLASVIKVLLWEIDPTIQHEETVEFSEFFYGDLNPISFQQFRVLLTQKSNIIAPENSEPANRAPIKFKQLMDMIRDCFKCFWYVEDNKFKIEHVKFFRLGGTYTGTPKIGADLTFLERVRGGKKWAFSTSAYDFDKGNMAERFEFTWADSVSPAFIGFPIDVVSNYVEKGRVDQINVGAFTSDIDYMLLNPGEISKSGFALLGATLAECQKNKPDDYHDNFSSGTNEISEPSYKLYTSLSGNSAIMKFWSIAYVPSTCTIVFLKEGVIISSQDTFNVGTVGTDFSFEVEIPSGADAVAFNVVGGDVSFLLKSLVCKDFYDLPFVSRQFGLSQYIMQNGYMSWVTLQPNYYMHDLPAKNVIMNNEPTTAISIEKNKKQTVQYPSVDDPDVNKLIKTYLGNGQIDKISINLSSRMNKIVLKYDTE